MHQARVQAAVGHPDATQMQHVVELWFDNLSGVRFQEASGVLVDRCAEITCALKTINLSFSGTLNGGGANLMEIECVGRKGILPPM